MAVDSNLPIPSYPTQEPTSALNFGTLIADVAYKAGMAYYGEDGNGAPQVPVDAHDLAICQNIVNDAIRMFLHDAPKPLGWKWARPIAQVDLWPQISYDAATPPTNFVTIQANPIVPGVNGGANLSGTSLLTLTTPGVPSPLSETTTIGVVGTPAFYQSMEYRQIFLNGNPPPNTAGFYVPQNSVTATPQAVTSLTYNNSTGLCYCTVPSGTSNWSSGNTVTIASAQQSAYNGNQVIKNVSSGTTFTFRPSATPTANTATGSITATFLGQIGVGFTILYYLNSTQIVVDGDATVGGTMPTYCPFSMASAGDYTLPANFGGQYTGAITYIANTNRGMILTWTDETTIRGRRQNYNIESGTPYMAAVRLMPTPSYNILTNTSGFMLPRRRWELMTWRISSEFLSVIFPYTLQFNNLVNLTDISPAPFSHDETIKAACYALVEKQIEDTINGPDWQYYQHCLQNSYRVDALSAPPALGYFSNPNNYTGSWGQAIKQFRAMDYQRPTVPVFPQS